MGEGRRMFGNAKGTPRHSTAPVAMPGNPVILRNER
jgi:hypothetical protein